MRDQRLGDSKTKDIGNQSDADAGAVDAKNQPQLLQLQSQLQANQAEIRNRGQMITDLQAKIDEYQARLNQEPVREQQLADLRSWLRQSKLSYG